MLPSLQAVLQIRLLLVENVISSFFLGYTLYSDTCFRSKLVSTDQSCTSSRRCRWT